MRVGLLLFALILGVVLFVCVFSFSPTTGAAWIPPLRIEKAEATKVNFDSQIKPIFEKGCKPCHFTGGTMYEQLPFDRQETIRKLGAKLYTRIKDEKDRKLIGAFLEQQ